MPFEFRRLQIPDLVLIVPRVFPDGRGFFMELYKRSDFAAYGVPDHFVQDCYSHSVRGVLRGLHYQKPPRAQGKLVTVLRGEVFDVAVDLRRSAPTYGRWLGVTLSDRNRWTLWVPPGFAHGFCVLSDEADVLYKVTEEYAPDLEGGIRWDDPDLGIDWPIRNPILSPRDATLPFLRDADFPEVWEGTEGWSDE
jgi:dTDP-4-dehydrorhamnose 3,5-epimerase